MVLEIGRLHAARCRLPAVEEEDFHGGFVAELLGLGEIGFRFGLVALSPVVQSRLAVRLGVLRIEPDGLRVIGNRLVTLTLISVGRATDGIRNGILRVEPMALV